MTAVDVLKVAHHGSRTATSEAWLDALQPRVALISAGHRQSATAIPRPRPWRGCEAHGARVLRTDLDGDLQVSTDGHDLRVGDSGGRPVADRRRRPLGQPATRLDADRVQAAGYLCAIPVCPATRLAAPAARSRAATHPARGRPLADGGPPSGPTPQARARDRARGHLVRRACYDRVDRWCLPTRPRPPCCCRSRPRPGCDDTPRPSRTSRRSWPAAPSARATRSTVPLVEAAALLHDLDKALPSDDPLRALGHGHAGARWLDERGYEELAPAVDSHPVGRLTDQPYEDWVPATTLEQRSWPMRTSAPSAAS